jgi:hypothetical protein
MQRALGESKVAEPIDVKWGPHHDITDIRVYALRKQEAKKRIIYYNHYAPRCSSFSKAQRKYMERTKEAPFGVGIRDAVIHDNVMFLQTLRLCNIHHAVGDAFSIEHIYPTLALEFDDTKALLALPGVFLVVFDNCGYGEHYRHRQCVITNQRWLAWLSPDGPGASATHMHHKISDDGMPTPGISVCVEVGGALGKAV